MTEHLHDTLALCPECLKTLKADVRATEDKAVWMYRTCPDHGEFATRIWPDVDHYRWLTAQAMPKTAPCNTIPATAPCPFGCGTCSRHERRGTLLEIECTWMCNLKCPVCFMSADTEEHDPTIEEIGAMYDVIADAVGTDGAVQLTGGEPTCRKDLPEIIRMGREKGFWGIELNTNGLVIASRPGYLEKLRDAGVTGLFLSFDGLTGDVYEATCGRDILDVKLRCVERCREAGVQVVLCMTILAGVNDDQLGDVLRFAQENSDVVAGLALQPAFTSGRFNARQAQGMTAGDTIFKLAEQSQGLIDVEDIWPLGCSNPLCDTGVFLVKGPAPAGVPEHESGFWPATKYLTTDEYHEAYSPDSPQGSVFLDILAKKGIYVADGLSIVIMDYMDAYTMDIQRLRECSMMVTVPSGLAIPFCSYHLTDAQGCRVYPPWMKEELRGGKVDNDLVVKYLLGGDDGK